MVRWLSLALLARPTMDNEPDTRVLSRDDAAAEALRPHGRPTDRTDGSPRSSIGRYELIHRLGHGGMATVHLGRALGKAGFEKLVAVKVIHDHLASEPEFVEMFLDEARIAARIHHPHVVEILDLGEDLGTYYMVMEYVEGDTLSALVRQLRKDGVYLPFNVCLQIVADACEGLGAAHALHDPLGHHYRLVHRDVSPQNLLVGADGRVKVVDFGIMKAAGKRSSTLTGQLRGKLAYMSPEQARSAPLDHRTDIFALGAVLWELCTNERLFHADSDAVTLELVSRCEIGSVRDRRSDVPDAIERVLHRALARDPEARYDTADAMLQDVRRALRELEDESDPRLVLGEIVRARFGSRIEYARAAVRSSHGSLVATDGRLAPTAIIDETGSRPTAPSSASLPIQTLTGQIAGAPARHWSLWLVLPLIGAAIGTAVVTWNDSRTAPPLGFSEPSPTVPEPLPNPRRIADEPAAAATIKWAFNTDPAGAMVFIDGQRQDRLTPMDVALSQSERAVSIRLELEGYEPKEVRLIPMQSANHQYALRPTQVPVVQPSSRRKAWLGPARLKPSTETRHDSNSQDRTFDPPPDFGKLERGGKSNDGK